MGTVEIIAQIIGIIAMAFNILSYQGKKQSTVFALQLIGGGLFAVNFMLLDAPVGGLLNIIAAVRAIVFLYKEKLKAERPGWFAVFVASYIAVYVLNFTVFGKEATALRLVIELLPVIGMIALHVGYTLKNASDVRKCGLISSPAWLIYNIISGSWGAIICEILTLGSIVVGIFRHDKEKVHQNP